jgi:ankyrin repeat protein
MPETLLHRAVKLGDGDVEVVVLLLSAEQDLDINAVDQDRNTPLHYAVMNNNLQIVDILLQATADPFIKNNKGEDPLSLANSTGNKEIVELLNEARQPINDENLPLFLQEVFPEIESDEVYEVYQYYNKIERIAAAGKLNEKDGNHHTLLYREVEEGNINDVSIILSFGADTEITDKFGMTPLHRAASKCDCKMISLLLEHNANILAKTLLNSTPFKLAQAKKDDPTCQNSYQKATEILKDAEDKLGPQKVASAQAERDAKDEAKRAARAEEAARAKSQKATIYFVSTYPQSEFSKKHGISLPTISKYKNNSCNKSRSHAAAPYINRAAEDGNIDDIRNYLNTRGNPNSQDHNNNTLLHQAAAFNHPSIVELLFNQGADPSIKNIAGKDPLFYAKTIEKPEIVELLNQAQSKEKLELLMEEDPPNPKEEGATLGKRTFDQRSTHQEQTVKGPHTERIRAEMAEQKQKKNNFFEL